MPFTNILTTITTLTSVLVLGMTTCGTRAATSLGEINVTQAPYSADMSGGVDDSAAFQGALNTAAATGAIVMVPAGQYKFTKPLSVPNNVVLAGVNDGERSYGGYMNGTTQGDVVANKGTVFLVTGGAGTGSGAPFITLDTNSTLQNVTIYYPNQSLSTSAGWKGPTRYPPAIRIAGRNGAVENVCGINPYKFIEDASIGSTIRRVVGQPLLSGISVDADTDPTGQSGEHIEDVHFLDTWDSHGAMTRWMQSHTVGFCLYRADEFAMRNCSCTGDLFGFCFRRSGAGVAYGTLTGCSAMQCNQAVTVTDSASGVGGGLVFDGGGFGSSSGAAVSLANSNTGNVMFNSCRFYTAPGSLVTNASATGSVVSFLACSFDNWGTSASSPSPSVPCVYCGDPAHPGSASGKTRILSCNFGVDQYQYTYTPGEASVLFENNSTVSGVRVQVSGVKGPSAADPKYTQIDNF